MADGNEYNLFTLKESGQPVEVIYPTEGTPFIASPSAVMAKAPQLKVRGAGGAKKHHQSRALS